MNYVFLLGKSPVMCVRK